MNARKSQGFKNQSKTCPHDYEEPGELRKIEISLVVSLEMCNFAQKVGMKMC